MKFTLWLIAAAFVVAFADVAWRWFLKWTHRARHRANQGEDS
jgi:hypothetical protein